MIINNTQANIFKVNGGLADIFANRPAASGSFYVFYSIDTQEIFYDSGAWILLGSGGAVNIYNSDGTLTGNRDVFQNNRNLRFRNIGVFAAFGNNVGFFVDGSSNYIRTELQGLINGINFTFQHFQIGQIQGGQRTNLNINDFNQLIKTSNQGNVKGLLLDFANNYYQFGQIIGAYQNLTIDAANFYTYFSYYGLPNGLQLNYANNTFDFGGFNSGNGTYFSVDDTNQIIKTINQTNNIGLKLDFANGYYQFGTQTFANGIGLLIDNNSGLISTEDQINGSNGIAIQLFPSPNISIGDYANAGNNTIFYVEDTAGIIRTIYQGNDIGLKLDFANSSYELGDLSANGTFLQIANIQQIFQVINNTNANGLIIDFNQNNFQFGQITGGNTTYLTIDDVATYPIQIDGTNILSGTSGGSSGQHLKIKLNGVDYKIKLENP
jgi:hypothetical protein